MLLKLCSVLKVERILVGWRHASFTTHRKDKMYVTSAKMLHTDENEQPDMRYMKYLIKILEFFSND